MNDISNFYKDYRDFFRVVFDLRTVRRRIILEDGVNESDADHSWSVAMLFIGLLPALRDEFGDNFDALKVMKMAAIHDIPEIHVGDTATWDEVSRLGKEERELAAAKEIFGELPREQAEEIFNLWVEAEAMETLESKIVKSLDRFDPFFKRVIYKTGFSDISPDKDKALEVYDKYQKDQHTFSKTIYSMYQGARDEAIRDGRFKEKKSD